MPNILRNVIAAFFVFALLSPLILNIAPEQGVARTFFALGGILACNAFIPVSDRFFNTLALCMSLALAYVGATALDIVQPMQVGAVLLSAIAGHYFLDYPRFSLALLFLLIAAPFYTFEFQIIAVAATTFALVSVFSHALIAWQREVLNPWSLVDKKRATIIFSCVAYYLFVASWFALLFNYCYRSVPGSFSGELIKRDINLSMLDFMLYSMKVLSHGSYSYLVPVSVHARAIAALEMLVAVFLSGFYVGLLVSYIQHRGEQK